MVELPRGRGGDPRGGLGGGTPRGVLREDPRGAPGNGIRGGLGGGTPRLALGGHACVAPGNGIRGGLGTTSLATLLPPVCPCEEGEGEAAGGEDAGPGRDPGETIAIHSIVREALFAYFGAMSTPIVGTSSKLFCFPSPPAPPHFDSTRVARCVFSVCFFCFFVKRVFVQDGQHHESIRFSASKARYVHAD